MSHSKMMKALVWTGPREMVIRQVPAPTVDPDEVLIRVAYSGICGSELSGYLGHNALRVPPLIMGHEFSGIVEAVGENVQSQTPELSVGDRVTANPMIYDRTCPYCQEGLTHLCLGRQLVGAHRPGSFAEFVSVPAHVIYRLPDGLGLREGALTEPTACAVRIVRLMGDISGRDVLIVGTGTLGLLSLQVALVRGAGRIFVVDTNVKRLSVASELGGVPLDPHERDIVTEVEQATKGLGVDVALDAVGAAITRAQCIQAVRRAGRVILSGLHDEVSSMPVADVIRKELTLQGSFCYTPDDFQTALTMLSEGRLTVGRWVVTAPLVEGRAWFERLVGDPGSIAKVLLVP